MTIPPAFERIEDPEEIAKVLNPNVKKAPGKGGLCIGEAWRVVGPTPVTVYRL